MNPRECFEELERYINNKYAEELSMSEDNDIIPKMSKRLERIVDELYDGVDITSLEELSDRLSLDEKIQLAREIPFFVANSIGDLIETYRYESVDDDVLPENVTS